MKNIYSLFSFVFLFACFLMPFMMINAINFGTSGEFLIFLMVLFPLLGMISAFIGKKGFFKLIGVILNGVIFSLVLFIVVTRTAYL